MCRLLGVVSRDATTLRDALGDDIDRFTSLSQGLHRDGWGLASEHGSVREVRLAAEAAHTSPDYAEAMTREFEAGIVHLRAATLGLPVSVENTHPFIHGEWSFAHNGSITDIHRIETLIDPDLRPLLRGDTDSERYLLTIMSGLRRHDVVDAVRRAVSGIDAVTGEAAVNAVLLGPDQMVVVSDDTVKSPEFVGPDYYELKYRISEGAVAVTSSGWVGDGWETLPSRSILTIDRVTLATEVHDLDGELGTRQSLFAAAA